MSNFAEKKRVALYLLPETIERVEKLYDDEGFQSRSEFIEKAINFYCGYITSDNYKDYFPNVIVNTVKGSLDSMENRMASLLFKMSVELAMNLYVTASLADIDEQAIKNLRGECIKEVKRLNGRISFEDGIKEDEE